MRALITHPQHRQGLLTDVPQPLSQQGWVRLKVARVGICRTDLRVLDGTRDAMPGRVSGHELAGWVDEGPRTGERVVAFPLVPCETCQGCTDGGGAWMCGHPQFLGVEYDGAFAEYVCVPEKSVYPIGDMAWEVAAYWEPVAAAWGVREWAIKNHHQHVGVLGGSRIAQLIHLLLNDAQITTQVVEPNTHEKDVCDVIVECWCDLASMNRATEALKPGGTLILKSRPTVPCLMPVREMVEKNLTLQAIHYGDALAALHWLEHNPQAVGHLMGQTFPLSRQGVLDAFSAEIEEIKKIFFDPTQVQ